MACNSESLDFTGFSNHRVTSKNVCFEHFIILPYIFHISNTCEHFVTSISGTERTEVLYGSENVIFAELRFFSEAKSRIDTFMDFTRPPLAIEIESIRNSYLNAKNRDVKLRYITEITTENISTCKELMKIAEIRHLDGIKGNFMVSEGEYLAPAALQEISNVASQIIYSNVKEIVKHQQYIFDTLWNKAIPATKRIREIQDKQTFGITEVLYGAENAVGRGVQFMKNVKKRMDICFDSKAPSIVVEIDAYRNGYKDIRNRGGTIRAFTEITRDNIHYCKELRKLVDELRHLEGMKGGIAVSEAEYMATTVLQEATPLTQVIYSNIREVVEQMQYIFDIFWYRAIPASQKIREIEEGILPIETKVLENPDEIFDHMKNAIENASDRSVCSSLGGMQLIYDNFFDSYKKIIDKHKTGEGDGVRWITTINNDSKDLVKIFLDAGAQIRHVKNLPPMNFAVDARYFHATVEKMEGGKMMRSLLTSNEPVYVNHYNSIFEESWKNGIDAVQRIRDIEDGVDLAEIEVIPRSSRARIVYLELVRNATEEILFIFPTSSAFIRQDKIGAIPLGIEAAKKRNVKVRILVPYNEAVENQLQIREVAGKEYRIYTHNIDIRYIEQMSDTKATILVVDRKESLVMELRDDSKTSFDEAIGLSTYSNSKGGVLSYVAIFENLWKQTELYEDIKEAHEQLKMHDIMQKEFINIAAHELRTPIQPILGLTELLRSKIKNVKQRELLDVTIRNAKRLQRLTEDILDVRKIETRSIGLTKELFNLNEIILNAISDSKNQIAKENKDKNLKLQLIDSKETIFIEADRGRIIQVISNLLSNAIKFTNEGSINVTTVRSKSSEVHVSVKDTGRGLDQEILPRLFSKFATKSDKGTGLGLFISKNIIEAHGGTIWAESNKEGKGATFSFSLPMTSFIGIGTGNDVP
jgi:two-component system sensor histidine kinase VicK